MKFSWKLVCIIGLIGCLLFAMMHIFMGQLTHAGMQFIFAACYAAGLSYILIREKIKRKNENS